MIARRHTIASFALGVAIFAGCSAWGQVDNIYTGRDSTPRDLDLVERYRAHGFFMDEQHRLHVEEIDGWMVINLRKRDRIQGGPQVIENPDTGEEQPLVRIRNQRPLAMVRSEVIAPAPPNYAKNPGRRYRIYIKGLEVAPEYSKVFEADAADALDAVRSHVGELYQHVEGIEREALFYGIMLSTRMLNEAFRLPADIPLTVLRSEGGERRLAGGGYERLEQGRLQRFGDVAEGQDYNRVFSDDPDLGTVDPETVNGPSYRRGSVSSPQSGGSGSGSHYRKKYRASYKVRPVDERARSNQMKGPGTVPDPEEKKEQPGQRGEPLTAPVLDFPAVALTQRDTLEILQGESARAPMAIRAEQ